MSKVEGAASPVPRKIIYNQLTHLPKAQLCTAGNSMLLSQDISLGNVITNYQLTFTTNELDAINSINTICQTSFVKRTDALVFGTTTYADGILGGIGGAGSLTYSTSLILMLVAIGTFMV
jgi:hypothetical protein